MSVDESATDSPLIQKLDWDSEYFGFNVAYIQQSTLTPDEQSHIEEFVERENISLLQYLCNCHDRSSVTVAEEAGYSFVDIRFTFKWTADKQIPIFDVGKFRFDRATEDDIGALRTIAHDAYRDSRYYYDGHFDKEKIVNFYQEWVEKGVRGTLEDYVFALYDKDVPIAFCTIQEQGKEARIGLVGVDGNWRGQGIGTLLINSVLKKLQTDGFTSVIVVTQGRNYFAQKLYEKSGFLTEKLELWYHKWYE